MSDEAIDKLLHLGKHVRVVGDGGQHDVARAEGVGQHVARIGHGQVVEGQVVNARIAQLEGELLGHIARAPVDRGVGNDNALILGS